MSQNNEENKAKNPVCYSGDGRKGNNGRNHISRKRRKNLLYLENIFKLKFKNISIPVL